MKSQSILILCLILAKVLFFSAFAYSQQVSASPHEVYHTIDSLNETAFEIKKYDVRTAVVRLSEAYALANQVNYKKGLATNLLYAGGLYYQNGFSEKALLNYYQSYAISSAIRDTFNIARAKQQIGNALKANGRFKEATKLFKEALDNYRVLNRTEDVINMKNYIGLMNLDQQQFRQAKENFVAALNESRKEKYCYGEKKSLFNLGLLEKQQGNFEASKKYLDSSLLLDKMKNDKYGQALIENELSEIASKERLFTASEQYAKIALEDARSNQSYLLIIRAIENLIKNYQSNGNLKEVAYWQTELIKAQKDLFNKERDYAAHFIKSLEEQQSKQSYIEQQVNKADQEAKTAQKILLIVASAFFLLVFLSVLLYKNYKKAQKFSDELEVKNKLIEKSASDLDKLNIKISNQNVSLSESNEMKDKLLSIISHDLRSPLNNTIGLLQLINDGVLNKDLEKELFVKLEDQYIRSLTLLDNLLFWIKGQAKGDALKKEGINVKDLISTVVEENKISLENKNVAVANKVDDSLLVEGDKEMLKVVFRNLLSNSIKFTSGNTKISFSASTKEKVEIRLEDQGIGMSEDVLRKIKERKYFTSRGTGNEIGSGFGLMLCFDLLKKQQGDLVIESKPGSGSSFTIVLPVYN